MKDPKNIQQLEALAPDWMGMIFYEKSPRHVSELVLELECKLELELPSIAGLENKIKRIGVFVNATNEYIDERIAKYKLAGIQFHGKETPAFCESYKTKGLITIKAFSVDEGFDFGSTQQYEATCDYFIFDTKGKNPGGNGITYDWNILKKYSGTTPFLLSGGINASMVGDIKKFEHPRCVGIDINSGFEIEPGLKNIELIKKFKHDLSN